MSEQTQFLGQDTTEIQQNLAEIYGDQPDSLAETAKELGIQEAMYFLTAACPLGCAHCYVNSSPELQETTLDATATYRLINAGIAPRKTRISGGEPTLHPECKGIIKFAAEKSESVFVYTTMVKWAVSPKLARYKAPQDRHNAIQEQLLSVLCEFPANVNFKYGLDEFHFAGQSNAAKLYLEIAKALILLPHTDLKCGLSPIVKYTLDWERSLAVFAGQLGITVDQLRNYGFLEKGGYISANGRANNLSGKYELKVNEPHGGAGHILFVGNVASQGKNSFSLAFQEEHLLSNNTNHTRQGTSSMPMTSIDELIRDLALQRGQRP